MRTTKTKMLWLGVAAAAVLAMMLPAGAQAQTKPPIKIAHTGPMSGILATTGKLQSLAEPYAISAIELLRAHRVAQMRDADAPNHRRIAKRGWRAREMVEESNAGAEQNRGDVDIELIE